MKYKLTTKQIKDYYIDLFNDSPKYNNGDVDLGSDFDYLGDNDFIVNVMEYIDLQEKLTEDSPRSIFNSILNYFGDELLDTRFYDSVHTYGGQPIRLGDCLEGVFQVTYE